MSFWMYFAASDVISDDDDDDDGDVFHSVPVQ